MVEGSYYLSYLCVNCSATAKTTIDNSEVSNKNSVNLLASYQNSSATKTTCKNGKIFGTPCNLSGKCVGGSCLIPTR